MAFLILLIIFSIILRIIIKISGLVEDVFEDTEILKLPLKILGGILGAISSYVALFIILLVLSMPLFDFKLSNYISKSTLKGYILNNTILISKISKPLVKSIDSVRKLELDKNLGKEEFNCKTIDIFKKNKIVTEESLEYLKEHKKLDLNCE